MIVVTLAVLPFASNALADDTATSVGAPNTQPSPPAAEDQPVSRAADPYACPDPEPCTGPDPCVPMDFTRRRLVLHGVASFRTYFAYTGLDLEYDVDSAVALGAGAGLTLGGPAVTALVRVRPFVWPKFKSVDAVVLDGRFSWGKDAAFVLNYGGNEAPPYRADLSFDSAFWIQAEAGWEHRTVGGFSVYGGIGVALLLNPGSGHCDERSTDTRVPCDARRLGFDWSSKLAPLLSVTVGVGHDLL
jgi:hypothetical protein